MTILQKEIKLIIGYLNLWLVSFTPLLYVLFAMSRAKTIKSLCKYPFQSNRKSKHRAIVIVSLTHQTKISREEPIFLILGNKSRKTWTLDLRLLYFWIENLKVWFWSMRNRRHLPKQWREWKEILYFTKTSKVWKDSICLPAVWWHPKLSLAWRWNLLTGHIHLFQSMISRLH